VPDFRGLPRGQRQLAKSELRSRCRSRRNTARRRKKPVGRRREPAAAR
jgi:hypothetical protein